MAEISREEKYFRAGVKAGLWAYSHWKDGEQYVGTCGGKLKDALEAVDNGKYDEFCDIEGEIK